jgi:hypothetical protein
LRPAKQPKRPRRSAREIAKHADQILESAARKKLEYDKQGLRSVTLPRAELIEKLTGKMAHSPFLTQVGWGPAIRGANFVLNFGIMNPDPRPYDEANLGLSVYWGPANGVASPGESLLAADKALGVLAIDLGVLNPSASLYYVSANHVLPAGLAAGGSRSDVSYLLYEINAFRASVVLERGSLSVAIA